MSINLTEHINKYSLNNLSDVENIMDGQEIAVLGDINKIISVKVEKVIQDKNIVNLDLINFNCYSQPDGTLVFQRLNYEEFLDSENDFLIRLNEILNIHEDSILNELSKFVEQNFLNIENIKHYINKTLLGTIENSLKQIFVSFDTNDNYLVPFLEAGIPKFRHHPFFNEIMDLVTESLVCFYIKVADEYKNYFELNDFYFQILNIKKEDERVLDTKQTIDFKIALLFAKGEITIKKNILIYNGKEESGNGLGEILSVIIDEKSSSIKSYLNDTRNRLNERKDIFRNTNLKNMENVFKLCEIKKITVSPYFTERLESMRMASDI